MFNSTTIPVLEQVVNFAQARHGVLAGNIANIDTPGYRTGDLSPDKFEARLKRAIESRDTAPAFRSPGQVGVSEGHESLAHVGEDMQSILFHDDSDVSLEQQIAEMSKNQGLHNMALSIMTSQFRLLESAIRERVV